MTPTLDELVRWAEAFHRAAGDPENDDDIVRLSVTVATLLDARIASVVAGLQADRPRRPS